MVLRQRSRSTPSCGFVARNFEGISPNITLKSLAKCPRFENPNLKAVSVTLVPGAPASRNSFACFSLIDLTKAIGEQPRTARKVLKSERTPRFVSLAKSSILIGLSKLASIYSSMSRTAAGAANAGSLSNCDVKVFSLTSYQNGLFEFTKKLVRHRRCRFIELSRQERQ